MHHRARQQQSEVVQSIMSPQTDSQSQRWQQIRGLCDTIAHEFHPDKIVLFGSYAYGKPRPDSDVDLLVIMPFEGSPFRQAPVILNHVVRTVGVLQMDLLVRTATQVQERLHMGDSFMRAIIEHGKVMYSSAAPDAEGIHAPRCQSATSNRVTRQARGTVDSYEADPLEWISKAEEDWHVAQMSYRARTHPSYDTAVFHAQQCVEKYLKARLEEAGIPFGRTHDLLVLHQLALPLEPAWAVLQPLLVFLNPFTVAYCYPGIAATKADAKDALRYCREVRRTIRRGFGWPV